MGRTILNPDAPFFEWGILVLNSTIVCTWIAIVFATLLARFATRAYRGRATSEQDISRGQHVLEVLVISLRDQIEAISQQPARTYLPFVGTLFVFLVVANLLSIVPGYVNPTSSLSTSAALASCVFFAVPIFGIRQQGLAGYLRQYIRPSVLMLPFNLIGELSRTLALAVRLYGNMMSGTVIAAVLLSFAPLFLPLVAQTFGLLTGMIQAYIFSVLTMVYIASATRSSNREQPGPETSLKEIRHG